MKKIHYAWAVCTGCAIMLFVTAGLAANCMAVAYPFFRSVHGFSATQVSMISTVSSLSTMVFLLTVTAVTNKLGYRVVCVMAVLSAAASLFIFAFTDSIWLYYVGAVIGGIKLAYGYMVPTTILISRWFNAHRGVAMGICTAITGLAPVIFSPILTTAIETRSLRFGMGLFGAISLVCAVPVFLLIRAKPADKGLKPLGEASMGNIKNVSLNGRKLNSLKKTLLLFAGAILGAMTPIYGSIVLLNTTAGFDPLRASFAFSAANVGLMGGKLLFGVASDRWGNFRTNMAFLIAGIAGVFASTPVELQSEALMFIGALLIGVGAVTTSLTLSAMSMDFSPPEQLQETVREIQVAYYVGSLGCALGIGVLADATGSYKSSFIIYGVLLIIGTAIIAGLYADRRKAKSYSDVERTHK